MRRHRPPVPANARRRAGRVLRGATAVATLGLVGVSLAGCDIYADVESFTDMTTGCENWTIAPKDGVGAGGTYGPYTATTDEYDNPIDPLPLVFHAQAVDGAGTVLFSTDPVAVVSIPGEPVVYDYDPEPSVNPIVGGVYDQRGMSFGDDVLYCPGLPFQARAHLAPGTATLAATLPVFDVVVSSPVTGLDPADLELGGTAGPTGATVTPRTVYGSGYDDSAFSLAERNLVRFGTHLVPDGNVLIYRIAITGATGDGTVTMRLPEGILTSSLPGVTDSNVATTTVSAIVDRTGPTLAEPDDITRQLTPGETSAAITWTAPVATDANGVAAQSCAPASGSTFTPGDTTVTCTATDTVGNSSTSAFTVSVRAAQTPTVQFAPDRTGNPDQGDTATFTVTGTDYTGATAPLPASDYTVTSSVATDVIQTSDGSFRVTFPHASPHVITVMQTSTGASSAFTVQVTPAAAPSSPAALGATGAEPETPLTAAAVLLLLGSALLALGVRQARRRARQSA